MLQCPSSLKQINFKMECFSHLSDKPSIYYKYRGDLLQHSVVIKLIPWFCTAHNKTATVKKSM